MDCCETISTCDCQGNVGCRGFTWVDSKCQIQNARHAEPETMDSCCDTVHLPMPTESTRHLSMLNPKCQNAKMPNTIQSIIHSIGIAWIAPHHHTHTRCPGCVALPLDWSTQMPGPELPVESCTLHRYFLGNHDVCTPSISYIKYLKCAS